MYDVHRVRLDVCPKASREQAMREWTEFTKEWLKSAPDVLLQGQGRYRLHNAITTALEGKPRVKTTWLRLLKNADKERSATGDWEPLDAILDNLKEMVVAEEKKFLIGSCWDAARQDRVCVSRRQKSWKKQSRKPLRLTTRNHEMKQERRKENRSTRLNKATTGTKTKRRLKANVLIAEKGATNLRIVGPKRKPRHQ